MVNTTQPRSATGSYRRDVMKLIGAGTAAAAFGGVAAADEHEADPTNGDPDDVDDTNGDQDDGLMVGAVHTVRTLIGPSTNPERPADFYYQPTGLHVDPGDVVKFVFETPDHTVTTYHPAFGMQRRIPAGVHPFSTPIMGWDPRSLPDDVDMPPAENGEHGGENGQNGGDGETDDGMNGSGDDNGENGTDGENGVNGEDDENGMGPPRPTSWLYAFETPGVYDMECAPHEGFGMAMRVVVGDETETTFETSSADDLPPPRAGPVGLARQVLTDPSLEPEAIVEAGRVEWTDLEANGGSGPDDGENGSEDGEENGDTGENGTEDDAENGSE